MTTANEPGRLDRHAARMRLRNAEARLKEIEKMRTPTPERRLQKVAQLAAFWDQIRKDRQLLGIWPRQFRRIQAPSSSVP